MREEIRELQERRAAAMMSEIVELQKERDLAVGKTKRLETKLKGKGVCVCVCVRAETMVVVLAYCADMENELAQMRSSVAKASAEVKGDLVGLLRQALREEQLLSKDLKRKLQSVKTVNASLTQQLQEARQTQSPDTLTVSLSL